MLSFSLKLSDVLVLVFALCVTVFLVANARRGALQLTPLRGPKSKSILFGVSRYLINAEDSAEIYETWASQYGLVYQVPGILGYRRVVLCDPKAVAHFFSRETTTYVHPPTTKLLVRKLLGGGIIISEGDDHKRMRKGLTPAFNNAAIRQLTSVFYDSAHKLKSSWDGLLESDPRGRVIDVQTWMNRVSLDSMGIAGFSHDFNSLGGEASSVASLFDKLAGLTPTSKSYITRILAAVGTVIFLLGTLFPVLFKLPTEQTLMFRNLRTELSEITERLLQKTKKEQKMGIEEKGDKSIIGLLIKAEDPNSQNPLSKEELSAQITLLLAGYETTSISLTWALIELCIHPVIQAKLRAELPATNSEDPTWEQLTSTADFPYLDAVVHEVLRVHPPVDEGTRIAKTDDFIPLSNPITLPEGGASYTVSTVVIPRGTLVSVPITCMNRSNAFWGPDAKEFNPERWLENGIPNTAKEISGHRHLLTFSDGPRICLGKGFALTEFKVVLSFLIRHYTFEFDDGEAPKIVLHQSILPRPKLEGQEGARVPLRVKRVE